MTSTERIEITDFWDLVQDIARIVGGKYPGYTTVEDLSQEGAVWWYSKAQKYLPTYVGDASLVRLRRSLFRYMADYASAEKARVVGYAPRDQYPYSPREVYDLIPIALDPDGLPLGGHHEGPTPKGNLAEGGDALAAIVDVRRALDALPEADLHFLTLADDCSYDWDRIAARMTGGAPDSMRRRHARIAERMARWLSNQEDFS